MADISTKKFLEAYGAFLVQSWGQPPLKKAFKADPAKVLKEFGLDAEGAEIMVEPPDPTVGPEVATAESAARLWNEGKKAGKIRFIYPEQPPTQMEAMELSDDQLEAVAGGWSIGSCCCSPCCCC
ncbi:MAG: hypothetical protein GTO22_03325 [Gemmatimonadales bacterium]|nr:hypothetical protein [Gemmatimonadales bacterium]